MSMTRFFWGSPGYNPRWSAAMFVTTVHSWGTNFEARMLGGWGATGDHWVSWEVTPTIQNCFRFSWHVPESTHSKSVKKYSHLKVDKNYWNEKLEISSRWQNCTLKVPYSRTRVSILLLAFSFVVTTSRAQTWGSWTWAVPGSNPGLPLAKLQYYLFNNTQAILN